MTTPPRMKPATAGYLVVLAGWVVGSVLALYLAGRSA